MSRWQNPKASVATAWQQHGAMACVGSRVTEIWVPALPPPLLTVPHVISRNLSPNPSSVKESVQDRVHSPRRRPRSHHKGLSPAPQPAGWVHR